MKTAFHYHIGTGVQSMEETERLLAMTDPDLVGIVFDTGHSTLAGGDPVKLLEKHMDRVQPHSPKGFEKRRISSG